MLWEASQPISSGKSFSLLCLIVLMSPTMVWMWSVPPKITGSPGITLRDTENISRQIPDERRRSLRKGPCLSCLWHTFFPVLLALRWAASAQATNALVLFLILEPETQSECVLHILELRVKPSVCPFRLFRPSILSQMTNLMDPAGPHLQSQALGLIHQLKMKTELTSSWFSCLPAII